MPSARPITAMILLILLAACASPSATPSTGTAPAVVSTIQNKGSDTMVNLALAWAEQYQSQHPEVNISVTGGGSGTGIAALANNTVDIANASRAIKPEEEEAMPPDQKPVEFVVARDAIAVIVNPSNPVKELTLQQISDIYSGKINNWKDVGGEDLQIVRLSRETNSGTHVYFLEEVLRLGDDENKTLFSTDTLLLPSSEGITAEVRDNPHAIGYDGLGYITPDLKVIAVAKEPGGEYVIPSADTVNSQAYPIARDLYMYTAGQPTGTAAEYLAWIITPEAQEIVKELGFVPILVQ
jgi:phosphate transport system substrate-binding protein